jgi:hypothetical protein
MPKCYEPAYADFEREADAIRRDLAISDVLALHREPIARDRAAHVKAFAYVWLAAALEAFLRAVLQALARELTARNLRACDAKPCLLALSYFAKFDSLRDIAGMKQWDKRVDVLLRTASTSLLVFPEGQLPIDQRTPRMEHFRTIWTVYGFPGDPIPSPRHVLALQDLAEGRNDVAHGHTAVLKFGRRKAISDVIRIVQHVEEVAIHLASTLDTYLSGSLFLR